VLIGSATYFGALTGMDKRFRAMVRAVIATSRNRQDSALDAQQGRAATG